MKSTDYLLNNSEYHNPKLVLTNADKQTKASAIVDTFLITRAQIDQIQSIFLNEVENGLSKSPERQANSSLLMINTFVPALQSIRREALAGDYISLDIGSSNFRVLYSKLSPHASAETSAVDKDEYSVKYFDIPAHFRKGSSDRLFAFIAECIETFLKETPLASHDHTSGDILPLGFTFSFPMRQLAIDSGLLKTWTKNFDLPDAVEADAAKLLQRALDERDGNPFNVRVVALLNDSTGTLVMGSYADADCAIGMILGTGNNACYLERVERIDKWDPTEKYHDVKEVLVNMESGGFGDNGSLDFIRTEYDRAVDKESLFPGSFTFEKYVSGHFLGELLRFVMLDLAEHGLLFGGIITDKLRKLDFIKTTNLSLIEDDKTTSSVLNLTSSLGYTPSAIVPDDISVIRYICNRISIRGATILSAILASLVNRMDKRRTVIAVDGSLYRKHPRMQTLMRDFIGELVTDPNKTVQLIEAEDGSGKGAGIVAALATKLKLCGQ